MSKRDDENIIPIYNSFEDEQGASHKATRKTEDFGRHPWGGMLLLWGWDTIRLPG